MVAILFAERLGMPSVFVPWMVLFGTLPLVRASIKTSYTLKICFISYSQTSDKFSLSMGAARPYAIMFLGLPSTYANTTVPVKCTHFYELAKAQEQKLFA